MFFVVVLAACSVVVVHVFFFIQIPERPESTSGSWSAASNGYKRQDLDSVRKWQPATSLALERGI